MLYLYSTRIDDPQLIVFPFNEVLFFRNFKNNPLAEFLD